VCLRFPLWDRFCLAPLLLCYHNLSALGSFFIKSDRRKISTLFYRLRSRSQFEGLESGVVKKFAQGRRRRRCVTLSSCRIINNYLVEGLNGCELLSFDSVRCRPRLPHSRSGIFQRHLRHFAFGIFFVACSSGDGSL
jgi:hypothetical protein